jgi:hypothetical protein
MRTAVTGRALKPLQRLGGYPEAGQGGGFTHPWDNHTWRATSITICLENDGRLCGRSLFPETGDTIITEEVRKLPIRK